jgi:hypothetical protein
VYSIFTFSVAGKNVYIGATRKPPEEATVSAILTTICSRTPERHGIIDRYKGSAESELPSLDIETGQLIPMYGLLLGNDASVLMIIPAKTMDQAGSRFAVSGRDIK